MTWRKLIDYEDIHGNCLFPGECCTALQAHVAGRHMHLWLLGGVALSALIGGDSFRVQVDGGS